VEGVLDIAYIHFRVHLQHFFPDLPPIYALTSTIVVVSKDLKHFPHDSFQLIRFHPSATLRAVLSGFATITRKGS